VDGSRDGRGVVAAGGDDLYLPLLHCREERVGEFGASVGRDSWSHCCDTYHGDGVFHVQSGYMESQMGEEAH